jgi:hypothetical protein
VDVRVCACVRAGFLIGHLVVHRVRSQKQPSVQVRPSDFNFRVAACRPILTASIQRKSSGSANFLSKIKINLLNYTYNKVIARLVC